MSRKFSFSSTYNWEDSNLRSLLRPIPYFIEKQNDKSEPFNHYTHKNLGTQHAPFRKQSFRIHLDQLTNVKYLILDNFTHGSQMTISLGQHENTPLTQVYKQAYICKGQSLKKQKKKIDLGALPCRIIQIKVNKGCTISSNSISLEGIPSADIQNQLGQDYFKLLVSNPMKILFLG